MEDHRLDVGDTFLEEMTRKAHESAGEVVMVIRRPGGNVLLMTKTFYPAGVYRLPTGQIRKGERPEEALEREASEETGFRVRIERSLGAIRWTVRSGSGSVEYLSHIIITCETTGKPAPRDIEESIAGFQVINPCDLRGIADQLSNLPEPWRDWGRFRAIAHQFVYRELCPNGGRPSKSC